MTPLDDTGSAAAESSLIVVSLEGVDFEEASIGAEKQLVFRDGEKGWGELTKEQSATNGQNG